MREHLMFFKVSGIAVKVVAWFLLVLGVFGGITIILGIVPGNPRWVGIMLLAIYGFLFFILYFIAKISDVLVKIINQLEKAE